MLTGKPATAVVEAAIWRRAVSQRPAQKKALRSEDQPTKLKQNGYCPPETLDVSKRQTRSSATRRLHIKQHRPQDIFHAAGALFHA